MNPLVEEFFKRDLTEPEDQQLADWLASSPEDALKLAEGLGEMYAKSGLPAPVWPGGTMPPFGTSTGLWKPLVPSVLILALLGFSVYKWASHVPVQSCLPSSQAQVDSTPMKKVHRLVKPAPKHQGHLPVVSERNPAVQAADPQPLSSSSLELPSLDRAPAPQPQGHTYQQLSVVVEPTSPSLATVRVFNSANEELKTLYAGIIPAGRRTFTWDGKTSQGTVAPAGTYTIEVKSGDKVLRQEVKVEGN